MRQQTQCPVPKHGCKLSLPLWNLTSVLARSAAMSASTDSAAKHQKSARESKAAARHHDLICPAPYQRPESALELPLPQRSDPWPELSSRPEDSPLRALPDPYVNLSIHTAPDVRPFPWQSCQWAKSVGFARRSRSNQSRAPLVLRRNRLNLRRAQRMT